MAGKKKKNPCYAHNSIDEQVHVHCLQEAVCNQLSKISLAEQRTTRPRIRRRKGQFERGWVAKVGLFFDDIDSDSSNNDG
jgi:hypothetical protein